MISDLRDFIIVRGLNPTEEQYFGDLERIAFPQKTCAYRTGGQGRVPYGMDLAWLMECCAERDWTLGRNDVDGLSSFSKVPRADDWERVCASVDRYFGQYCFLQTPEIAQGGDIIWDAHLSGDWDPSLPPSLGRWCEEQGLKQTSADFGDFPHPTGTPFPSLMRPYVLEREMATLKYAADEEPRLAGEVTREKTESNVPLSAMQTTSIVGTRTIYSRYVDAHKPIGEPWEILHNEKRTVDFPVLRGFSFVFPRQKWSTRLIPETQDIWIPCHAHYLASASKGSADSVQQDVWAYVRVQRTAFEVGLIGNQECATAIELVLAAGNFDMDPLGFQHSPIYRTEFASLQITLHYGASSLITYRDSVTDPRS